MKNNYDIREVRLGKFIDAKKEEKSKDGKDILTCEMDPNIDKELICLIDKKNNVAYDIQNLNNSYKILKRNKEGILVNQEIYIDELYVISISKTTEEYKNFIDKLKRNAFKRKLVAEATRNNQEKAK